MMEFYESTSKRWFKSNLDDVKTIVIKANEEKWTYKELYEALGLKGVLWGDQNKQVEDLHLIRLREVGINEILHIYYQIV